MHRIVVLTAPSGAGKTTIARRVLAAFPQMRFSVSATTRPIRPGERNGVDYHFISTADFQSWIAAEALLEYEEVYPGRFYGTLKAEVAHATTEQPVLLDVDVKGAMAVKAHYGPEALVIFLHPPSMDVLAERLRARGTETPQTLQTRLDRVRLELSYARHCDVVVVNDDLERAVAETIGQVRAFLDAG
jgi:guanylate kinase